MQRLNQGREKNKYALSAKKTLKELQAEFGNADFVEKNLLQERIILNK